MLLRLAEIFGHPIPAILKVLILGCPMKQNAEHGRLVLPVLIHIVHTTQLARLLTAVILTAHTTTPNAIGQLNILKTQPKPACPRLIATIQPTLTIILPNAKE